MQLYRMKKNTNTTIHEAIETAKDMDAILGTITLKIICFLEKLMDFSELHAFMHKIYVVMCVSAVMHVMYEF